jgi:hypothetical protein
MYTGCWLRDGEEIYNDGEFYRERAFEIKGTLCVSLEKTEWPVYLGLVTTRRFLKMTDQLAIDQEKQTRNTLSQHCNSKSSNFLRINNSWATPKPSPPHNSNTSPD